MLPGLAGSTDCVLGDTLLSFDHNGAVWTRAKPQVGVAPKKRDNDILNGIVSIFFLLCLPTTDITVPDIVEEAEVDVALPNFRFCHLVCKQHSEKQLTG